jgi:hypothetical protein
MLVSNFVRLLATPAGQPYLLLDRINDVSVSLGELAQVVEATLPTPEPDPMDAAKARDDLERGTAHFDREFVEWRGTEVEVVD